MKTSLVHYLNGSILLVVCVFMLTLLHTVEAASTQAGGLVEDPGVNIYNGVSMDFSAVYTVTYHAQLKNAATGELISEGATLPIGTRIQVVPKNRSYTGTSTQDISWSFTGGVQGTPFGYWGNPTNACSPKSRQSMAG